MGHPLVSVVMPVYNAESYVGEAVESILAQTFDNFEFIILNDGSTDRSEQILKQYQQRDRRIRIVSRENRGLIATLNEGINCATGRYIARMDADDIALPERFSKQVEFLETHPDYVVVGSKVLLIDPEGLPICPFSTLTEHEAIDAAHMEGKGGAICHPASMLRRDVLQKVGGYRQEMKYAEDFDLFLRLAEVGKVANLPHILLKYRMHANSVGYTKRLEQVKSGFQALKEAHHRRSLDFQTTSMNELIINNESDASLSKIHRVWAWQSLVGGNVKTARKHAFLALKNNLISVDSWKVLACAMRGY
ncbi:MAG: glycosyltransferase [Leptolyngbyaceae cyanobacterium HOT.MB2.61]|jgi:glycosyltransferase involved in cell wall biosynthesis|nr:glycosyltransferase [Leptolyngbyaceae cyanobacterium HOT.MB2.61]